MPEEPKLNVLPGCLARAINSRTLLAGTDGWATRNTGNIAAKLTGTKSRSMS
ncbi:hypothetical protein D3C80_2007480 [compost metagenome]